MSAPNINTCIKVKCYCKN